MSKIKRVWYCPNCDMAGNVQFNHSETVHSVLYKMHDDHKSLSPDCDGGTAGMRTINMKWTLEIVDSFVAANPMTAQAPREALEVK